MRFPDPRLSLVLLLPLLPCGCEKEKKTAAPPPASTSRTAKEKDKPKRSLQSSPELLAITNAITPSKRSDGTALLEWVRQNPSINDREWDEIVMAGAWIETAQTLDILATLYLREPSTKRGIEVFRLAVEHGRSHREMIFVKRVTLAADPADLASLLLNLDEQSLDSAMSTLMTSDRVTHGEANEFMRQLKHCPPLVKHSALRGRLAGEFAALQVEGKPALEAAPPTIIREHSESAKNYVEGYFAGIFRNPDLMSHFTSQEILDAGIPEKILIKNMVPISRLDFTSQGPVAALARFAPGDGAVSDVYLKCIFQEWLEKDSEAATDYLETKGQKDPLTLMNIDYLISHARRHGDVQKADKWKKTQEE